MNLFKNIGVIIFEIARIYSFIFSFLYYKINRMTNPDGGTEKVISLISNEQPEQTRTGDFFRTQHKYLYFSTKDILIFRT